MQPTLTGMKHKREMEYDELLKQAQKQPETIKLARTYGKYERIERPLQRLDDTASTEYFSSDTHTR